GEAFLGFTNPGKKLAELFLMEKNLQ
ncbi:hypothetical protein MNBD_GAMMA04-131, partial [hydrothermal vent metagenome]